MVRKQGLHGESVFDVVNYVVLAIFCILFLYPFWELIVLSLMPRLEASALGPKFWTNHPTLKAYQQVLADGTIFRAYLNTTIRTVSVTIFGVFGTFCIAYPLSHKKNPLRTQMLVILIIPMFFAGGMVPSYLLIRRLGLLNNLLALILPALISPFNVLIMRNFIRSIPDSLEESAMIDGASYFQVMTRILMPLSMPIIATVALWMAVGAWNEWFHAMIYCPKKALITLQYYLRQLVIMNEFGAEMSDSVQSDEIIGESIKGVVILLSMGPILFIYPFIQRYFVQGIRLGAVKE